jgi:hypothetical protein
LKRFGGLLDSPLWLDLAPYASSAVPLMSQCQSLFKMVVNASQTLSQSCTSQFAPEDQWKCLVAEYALQYVTDVPYLLHAYQYDAYQLGHNSNGAYPTTDAGLLAYAENFRILTVQAAQKETITPENPGTAALLPACYKHCNTEGSTFSSIISGGQLSLEMAVTNWFFGDSSDASLRYYVESCSGFNCGVDCPSLTSMS